MKFPKPTHTIATDFKTITVAIQLLDQTANKNPFNGKELAPFQTLLDNYSAVYQDNISAGNQRFRLYELQALILKLQGKDDEAASCLWIATEYMANGDKFVSDAANQWLQMQQEAYAQTYSAMTVSRVSTKRRSRFIKWGVASIIIGLIGISGPISDHSVISSADPEMINLSQQAGMSRKAELIFLRTHPKLVDADGMQTNCHVNGQNAEQGCWVPASLSSDGNEHVYIRKFEDSRLQPIEIVTAAHEALHAAYAHLDSGTRDRNNQQLESAYQSVNDSGLNTRMAEYDKIEPGSKDNELHSILGTEQANLPQELDSYYSQYFTNRQLVTDANNTIAKTFADLKSQLDAQAATIQQSEDSATNLYNKSIYAANNGDAYSDDYYYNQYTVQYNSISGLITQYNASVDQYNNLTDEYNGKPLTSIQPIQQHTR